MTDSACDTIAAIATPPGRGGIGVLRLSGPDALRVAAPLLRLRTPLEANRARFCEIIDPTTPASLTPGSLASSDKLDEAVVTYFAAPRSYTGEDVLEIAAHGSPVLLDFLLRQTIARGARLAEPGEFTERAFLAGRLDLTQAEAVRDLIDAQTLYQARVAARQLSGTLSRGVGPIKQALIELIAQLEAGIDFAEDDTPLLSDPQILIAAGAVEHQLAALESSFTHGRLVHAGLTLAIVGRPNVGKSSLFNRLVERERAIVTATPGTTRDLVTERLSIGGIPVELIDTAGIRGASSPGSLDEAERLGIERSRTAVAEADLVLLVRDAADLLSHAGQATNPAANAPPITALDPEELPPLDPRSTILVLNKCDLLPPESRAHLISSMQQQPAHMQEVFAQPSAIYTSATTGEGLPALREALRQQIQAPELTEQGALLTNLRQSQAVQAAHAAILSAIEAVNAQLPHEMLLLDLYSTLRQLDTLTGQTTSEDILNLIFSTFCIGK